MNCNKERVYGMDGLRFIAAIFVVFFHYTYYSFDKEMAHRFHDHGM